jgi:hypothetical protein
MAFLSPLKRWITARQRRQSAVMMPANAEQLNERLLRNQK